MKRDSKTQLCAKPAKKVKANKKHRGGNKQNKATCEVIAAGWSTLVLNRVKDLRYLILIPSLESVQLMVPILDVL